MRPILALGIGILLLPCFASAQTWRIQASGGIATMTVFGGGHPVHIGAQIPNYALPGYSVGHIPGEARVFAAGGLALMRRSGNFELGLQIEAMSPRREMSGAVNERQADGSVKLNKFSITGYVGRPVVPVTAVYNYYAGPHRSSAFVGFHAGAVYAAGRNQADFNEMPVSPVVRMYYHNAWGFAAGLQAGYRKEVGPMDFGFMLQAKYMQLNLRHGSSDERYLTKMLVLPVQLYAGYRFGASATARPAPAAGSDD